MTQCDLFIAHAHNSQRDLKCIKGCYCKASEAHLLGAACMFVGHKSKMQASCRRLHLKPFTD